MGLYQSNVVLNLLVVVIAAVLITRYVITNFSTLFPWALHPCSQQCIDVYFKGPPKVTDPALLSMVKESYLTPPPANPDTTPFDIDEHVWNRLVDWNVMQENLKEIWKNQAPGVFVEVGVVDGEFMSQTLMLEKNYSWTGLLIEPDPRSFRILQERRRNAWTSPVCIHYSHPESKKYWLRDLEEELPDHFLQLLMARSKLADETLTGDEERGIYISVPCMPLSTLLLAANITSIDLLASATGVDKDEKRIKDVINSKTFDVKMLLLHFPTGRLFDDPYPYIPGYIIDMEHSTLLVKLYIRRSHCKLISNAQCKKMHHYDIKEACHKYLCFNFLTVWSYS
ncbi:uncharacterized protein LOC121868377 isoform X1 [Homarus americanus]|uniref:uncharacterized protein LOC121868377 isoform X1 n=2 Tax=Homarus americanus TaxID=6706 RepID=UPI001C48A688|nr:uncharacterized protein LOC121868377 isoform X1 [Homarus americanus]